MLIDQTSSANPYFTAGNDLALVSKRQITSVRIVLASARAHALRALRVAV